MWWWYVLGSTASRVLFFSIIVVKIFLLSKINVLISLIPNGKRRFPLDSRSMHLHSSAHIVFDPHWKWGKRIWLGVMRIIVKYFDKIVSLSLFFLLFACISFHNEHELSHMRLKYVSFCRSTKNAMSQFFIANEQDVWIFDKQNQWIFRLVPCFRLRYHWKCNEITAQRNVGSLMI